MTLRKRGCFWRTCPRSGFRSEERANVPLFRFSFRGNIRMYPRSGFRSGGTSAKTTLLENHPSTPELRDHSFPCRKQQVHHLVTSRVATTQLTAAGPKRGCLNVGAWNLQESGRKASLSCNAAFSMLHCSFSLAAAQLLVKMTSALKESQWPNVAVQLLQRSIPKIASATSICACVATQTAC